jgi:CheY-like chemotaxis protein/anti-sigma regulatory factor (Ser/Thr protein kinase)
MLDLRIVSSSLWVRSDRRLLRRVLQNLVSNAIKYTHSGKVLLGARRRGDHVIIQVCDTGPGIPPSKQALIFKEFQRLEPTSAVRGLGLGLSIVERIGKVLNHPVELKSVAGGGSTFSVTMPRAAAGQQSETAVDDVRMFGQIAGLTILCIDNESSVLDSMETLLSGWGCKVLRAANALDASTLIDTSVDPPDIILADYHLDQSTGLEAIAAVGAAAGLQLPAIVITADPSPQVQREVRSAGHALLRKPIKAASLRALLTKLANQHKVAAE